MSEEEVARLVEILSIILKVEDAEIKDCALESLIYTLESGKLPAKGSFG